MKQPLIQATEHQHHWLTVDVTPTTNKRYVLYDFCTYCHETTETYDGGSIPLRRRLWARIKHGNPTRFTT